MARRNLRGQLLIGVLLLANLLAPVPVGAASIGEEAATLAAAQMGAAYVLGAPVRPGPLAADPPAFDCSGLIWWLAGQLGFTSFPLVASTQATVGERLSTSPWSGELPIGALLFLADPAQGVGITHVSIHLGNNIAADCYNEGDGCIAHNVAADGYYNRYWHSATYPWGDTPVYASGGGGAVVPGAGSGAGSDGSVAGSIYTAARGTGVIQASLVTPLAETTAAVQGAVDTSTAAIDGSDPAALAAAQLAPVGTAIGYMKAVDALFPLRVVLLLTSIIVVLAILRLFSILAWIFGVLPG